LVQASLFSSPMAIKLRPTARKVNREYDGAHEDIKTAVNLLNAEN